MLGIGNKPKLYLALSANQECPGTYHSAFMVCSTHPIFKSRLKIIKYQLKNTAQAGNTQTWCYEHRAVSNLTTEQNLLALICLAEVRVPITQLDKILASTDIERNFISHDDSSWQDFSNSLMAMARALMIMEGALSLPLPPAWETISTQAEAFLRDEMVQGRLKAGSNVDLGIPTLYLNSRHKSYLK